MFWYRLARDIAWTSFGHSGRLLTSSISPVDVHARFELDPDPTLCPSDRVERRIWGSGMVSIESGVRCDFPNDRNWIGRLDSRDGCDSRLFFV